MAEASFFQIYFTTPARAGRAAFGANRQLGPKAVHTYALDPQASAPTLSRELASRQL